MKKLHNNLFVAGQIQTTDFQAIKQSGVTDIINNRPDGEESGQLPSHVAAEIAKEHGINYHYLPMANGQPMPEDLVDNFKAVINHSQGAVLAHCRSGMRSSIIWALGAIADNNVTVDEAVDAGLSAGIPMQNVRAILETAV